MPKIKQLPPHEAQKIAAGEVVERPANIVKELIENAIDAGATRIALYIEDAGKKLIRVVDNGYGMDTIDAQICFDRHATSKISSVDQLESITTFGFRGEALASIASVSQIALLTKQEQDLEGIHVCIEANNIKQIEPAACAIGTDMSVHNLFFNVPARKKFLKTDATEWRAIQLLYNAFCFDYPAVHFSLFSDGKRVLNCPATQNSHDRALQLWENITNDHLLTISFDDKKTGILIDGIISNHQTYRYDRSWIHFFVNKRWVKNQHLGSALLKGYTNVIPQGRYPLAAINITAFPHEVDINIHPRKEEVKFLHPRRIEQALQETVKSVLENALSNQLKKSVTLKPSFQHSYQEPRNAFPPFNPFNVDAFFSSAHKTDFQTTIMPPQPLDAFSFFDDTLPTEQQTVPALQQIAIDSSGIHSLAETVEQHKIEHYRLIGQFKSTYLLIEKDDGLFLIDQHAAHERILYELFSLRFHDVATVQLLFPMVITVTIDEMNHITNYRDIFAENGIIVEQCSPTQLMIQSLPVHLKNQSLDDIIKQTISWIIEHASLDIDALKKTINNQLQAQMACKAAVKAGDILSVEKMEQLLSDLEKTANRFCCPHGRPTGWLISLADIEKKFRRRL